MRARSDGGSPAAANRNSGIDALRGLSIILVIFNHLGIRIPLAKTALAQFAPAWLLRGLNWNGYEAVCVFFVISGFLITRKSLQRWGELRQVSLRGFYLLRASRIVPTLLLVVLLLSLLHLLGVANFVIHGKDQSLAAAIAAALGLYLNWYEGATGYLPGGWDVLWSLSIEEVFYLAFPLVCLGLGSRRWLLVLALCALALSLPYTHAANAGNEIWYEKAYWPGMSAIAIGVLTALLAVRTAPSRSWIAPMLCLLGIVGLGTLLFAGGTVWQWLHEGYGFVLTGSAAALVLGLHWQACGESPWRLRGLGWLRSCGRLSYEIYLFHMFCVFGVLAVANRFGVGEFAFLWYVPALALSWLLGLAVARGFSEPCERWLRRRFATQLRASAGWVSRAAA